MSINWQQKFQQQWQQRVQRQWQKRGLVNILLLPLTLIFYVIVVLRYWLYRCKILKSHNAHIPVIVVGNINVGGAGKTPLVIALGKLLQAQGIRYAVISKGYGGSYSKESAYKIVSNDDSASVVGDEPLLIKLKCNCPVVVAQSRKHACEIIKEQFPEVQIILTDDGLQHYQLHRDIEVCVINHKIGLGNGWVMPSGGLREPPSRLKNVDFVVANGDTTQTYHYVLADRGWHNIHNLKQQRYPDEFSLNTDDNLALSGIAHPQLFFNRIEEMGIATITKALPDHYALTQDDLPQNKTLLMTEKDWVKAKELQHNDAWYLSVEAVLSESFVKDFINSISQLMQKK